MKTFCRGSRCEPGGFAAHDAAEAERPGIIRDDAHRLVDGVFLAVEPQELFARLAEARTDRAVEFCRRRRRAAAGRGPG